MKKPSWHKDNPDIPRLLKDAEFGKGAKRAAAIKKLAAIKNELEDALFAELVKQPAFKNLSPEFLDYVYRSLRRVDPVLPGKKGRPDANRLRNLALVAAVVALRDAGVAIADACEKVRVRLALGDLDGFQDILSANRIQRIYQNRNKDADKNRSKK